MTGFQTPDCGYCGATLREVEQAAQPCSCRDVPECLWTGSVALVTDRPSALGALLLARRTELGYSLKATVKRSEKPISVAYLQRLEKGEIKSPSPFVLHELAHALAMPYVSLMEAAGYVYPCGNDQPRPGALV